MPQSTLESLIFFLVLSLLASYLVKIKYGSNFTSNENFKRKVPGRNNHNASKLIDKYNDLAREASSNGDKILSENYFQHADHFTRILNEREIQKKSINNKDVSKSDDSLTSICSALETVS